MAKQYLTRSAAVADMIGSGVLPGKANGALTYQEWSARKAAGKTVTDSYQEYLGDYAGYNIQAAKNSDTGSRGSVTNVSPIETKRTTLLPDRDIALLGRTPSEYGTLFSDPGFVSTNSDQPMPSSVYNRFSGRSGQSPDASTLQTESSAIKKTGIMDSLTPGYYETPNTSDPGVVALRDYMAANTSDAQNGSGVGVSLLDGINQDLDDYYSKSGMIKDSFISHFGDGVQYRDDAGQYFTNFSVYQSQLGVEAQKLVEKLEAYKETASVEEAVQIDEIIRGIYRNQDNISSMYKTTASEARLLTTFDSEEDYEAALFSADMAEEFGDASFRTVRTEIAACSAVLAMDNLSPERRQYYTDRQTWLLLYSTTPEVLATMTKEDSDWLTNAVVDKLFENDDLITKTMQTNDEETIDACLAQVEQNKNEIELYDYWNGMYESGSFYAVQELKLREMDTAAYNAAMNIPAYEYAKIFAIQNADLGMDEAQKASDTVKTLNGMIEECRDVLRSYGYTDEEIDDLISYTTYLWNSRAQENAMDEAEQLALEHPVQASAKSLFTQLGRPFGAIDKAIQKIEKFVTGSDAPISSVTPASEFGAVTDTIRGTVGDSIAESTGSRFLSGLYGGGMTAADIVLSTLLGQAFTGSSALGAGGSLSLADDAAYGLATTADDAAYGLTTLDNAAGKRAAPACGSVCFEQPRRVKRCGQCRRPVSRQSTEPSGYRLRDGVLRRTHGYPPGDESKRRRVFVSRDIGGARNNGRKSASRPCFGDEHTGSLPERSR